MNRLKNQRVYLAGAIDRCPNLGVAWRESITPFLKEKGVTVLNPMKKSISLGSETGESRITRSQLKESENYDQLSISMKEIRNIDLRMVDISDFLVVNIDLDIHSCGTYEEIFMANRSKKPIIIHMEQGKAKAPDWLFGTLPHSMFFSTWDDVKKYLTYIDSEELIDTKNRWRFFNPC
jgi:nucleoside 2-deoxyribosyltransferase